jgi:hypothetical protein
MISLLPTFSIPPDMKCWFNNGSIDDGTNDWSLVSLHEGKQPYNMGRGGLKWSQTPTSASNLGILKSILRFEGRDIVQASLQIPSYWPVSVIVPHDLNRYAEHSLFRFLTVYHGNPKTNSLWRQLTLL